MPDASSAEPGATGYAAQAGARTVQDYIDEKPIWKDGTSTRSVPMTRAQWGIWGLASAGKFFEGLVVFMTGVALSLMVREFGLSAVEKGMVGSAPLLGILIGATVLGGLADHLGRKLMFILEMVIFTVFLAAIQAAGGFPWVLVCLFGMGLALGCDYPIAHLVISESVPTDMRGKLVLSAFAFQAVGAMAGTGVGFLILVENPALGAWRWMYATAILPAVLVIVGRFFVPQSGHWLVEKGRIREAEKALVRLLARNPPYPRDIRLAPPGGRQENGPENQSRYRDLFQRKNLKATILAGAPWFLQDLGTYGIGIFTPTILASVIGAKMHHAHSVASLIHNDMVAAEGTAAVDALLLVGVVLAILLVEKVGRITMQIIGFLGCAAGLFLASLAINGNGNPDMIYLFGGFMLFNLSTNLGPNAMSYLLAGEVFPTRIRGRGAGFAASCAKVGAICTAFLFPIFLADVGAKPILYVLAGTSVLGAVVTWVCRIETRGISVEDAGRD